MTDRELLEFAAKAAGLKFGAWSDKITDYDSPHYAGPALHATGAGGMCNSWNPLTDDGDALRLAAKLKLSIGYIGVPEPHTVWAANVSIGAGAEEPFDGHYSLLRVITRAAACAGKNMP